MTQAAADLRYGCPTCRAVFRTGFSRCPSDGSPVQLLDADPLVGERFADRYIIEACAAEGGMGRIYRARHLRVSRRFAIKILFGELATDPKMRERFTREAEAASRLDHPNVGSVVDFGETEAGLLYLVMDFIEGRSLSDLLAAEAPLAPARARRLVAQLAAGLGHAHDQELIHRDFKPDNVLVSGSGDDEQAKIVDFGIALTLEQLDTNRLTTQGIVFGTPAYMAPEQATGGQIDGRADLFALGVILYEMLAGVMPFSGTQRQLAAQNLAVPPPPIAERVPGLAADPALEAIAQRLMAKKPDERFPDAAAVIEALAAAPAPPPRYTTGATEEIAVPPSRRRAAIAVAAALLVFAAAAAVVTRGGEPDRGTPAARAAVQPASERVQPQARAQTPPAVERGPSTGALGPKTAASAPPLRRDRRPRGANEAREPSRAKPAAGDGSEPRRARVDSGALQDLYVEVGRGLGGLDSRDAAVAALFRRYERIAIADALRKPALRREAMRELRALQADLARLGRR